VGRGGRGLGDFVDGQVGRGGRSEFILSTVATHEVPMVRLSQEWDEKVII